MPAARRVVVFTKPAAPGRVKTRLIGELSAAQAAALHEAFLTDLLARLEGRWPVSIAWALEPGESPPELGFDAFAQRGADLGERLYDGLRRAAAAGGPVVAIGSDHPDLPAGRVDEAFERLDAGARVVLGPAHDGGYYLIGLAPEAVRPELFAGIAWSTPTVLAETERRCRRLGLEPELLAAWDDVDTPEDLGRLIAALAGAPRGCPATRRLLADWGRL